MADLAPPVNPTRPAPLVLVLPGGQRLPIHNTITIGRNNHATTKLDDKPCRVCMPELPRYRTVRLIADAGSRYLGDANDHTPGASSTSVSLICGDGTPGPWFRRR